MRLEIVSPEGIAWQSDNVDSVSLPLVGGQIQVLEGHIPLIAMLDVGSLSVSVGGKTEELAVDKGYVNINGDLVSVMTEQAIKLEDIDLKTATEAKIAAERALEEARKAEHINPEKIDELERNVKLAMIQMMNKKN
ncbi:MAG: ATP synthase F1 subunit epsilon [Opitutales bacterium]